MQPSTPGSPRAQPFKPNFEQEKSFQELSSFFADWNENNFSDDIADHEKTRQLQGLVNNFFSSVCHTFIQTKINPKVFEMASHCIEYINKANEDDLNGSYSIGRDSQNNKNNSTDKMNNKILETEKKVTNRIAKQLNVRTPISEADLVTKLNNRQNKYKDVISEIIDTFELPNNTKPNAIVPVLRTKLDYDNDSKKNNKSQSQNLSTNKQDLKQHLIDVTNELSTVRHQLQKTQRDIGEKDNQIKEMKGTIEQLKSKSPKSPNAPYNQELNNELIERRVESGQLKSENTRLKNENKGIHQRCDALEQKLSSYKKQVIKDKEINTQLLEKLTAAKKQLQQQSPKGNESSQEIYKHAEIPSQFSEIFDQLTKQYESQSEELSKEAAFRNQLVESVQKLCSLNKELEHQLEKYQDKVEEHEKKQQLTGKGRGKGDLSSQISDSDISLNQRQQNPNQKQKQKQSPSKQNPKQKKNNENDSSCIISDFIISDSDSDINNDNNKAKKKKVEYVNDDLIEIVKDLVESINGDFKKPILDILSNEKQSIHDRVANSVDQIVNLLNDKLEKAGNVQIMLNTVGSVLVFLNNIIETGEITRWTMNSCSFDEARSQLGAQVQRITRFIKENCKGIIEDKAFLSAFLKFEDPTELDTELQSYMADYKEPKSDEGKDLMVLLLQAVSAGTVLHSFALQAKGQCSRQSQDLKSMKKQSEQQDKQEKKLKKDEKESRALAEKCTKVVRQVRSALRQAVIDDKTEPKIVLENLEKLDKVDPVTDEAYIKSLQDKLKSTMENAKKSEKENKKLKDEMEESLMRSEEQIGQENAQKSGQISSLESKVKNTKSQNQKLKEENEQLRQKLAKLENNPKIAKDIEENANKEKTKAKEIQNEEVQKLVKENETLKQEHEQLRNENEQLYHKIQEINDKAVEKLTKLKDSLKRSKQRMQEDFDQKKQEYRATIQQNHAQIESLESELDAAKSSENETKEVMDALHKDMDEIKESFDALQAEYKLTKSRLVGKEEQIKREKAANDAQNRLKQFAAKTEAQAQIDSFRYESNAKQSEFLMSICRLFSEYVDPKKPINDNSVLEMLHDVSEVTKQNAESAQKAKNSVKELEGVRKQLGLKKHAKIGNNIQELQNQNQHLNEQVKTLQYESQENKKKQDEIAANTIDSKEWQDWAYSLYDQINEGFDSSQTQQPQAQNQQQNSKSQKSNKSDKNKHQSEKSVKEIQNALEDAVLTAAGNPRAQRQLNFLRAEKKLYQKGITPESTKVKDPKLTISQTMAVVITIVRLMKLSGHRPSPFAVSIEPDDDEMDVRRSGSTDKQHVKPLFKQFVRNQEKGQKQTQK